MSRCFPSRFLFSLGLTLLLSGTLGLLSPSRSVGQAPSPTPTPSPAEPVVLPPSGPGNTLLSLAGGKQLMSEAGQAVSSQNYTLAVQKLQQAREVFNQLSNFYQDLAGSFSGIDNRISDSQRKKALESAQLRDQSTYQLALVHRAQNRPELAVPLLVQIVRSQQPTRDLGQKAYQQLLELGFVESPFPASPGATPAPTSSQSDKKR